MFFLEGVMPAVKRRDSWKEMRADLENVLLLVLENHQDYLASEALDALTKPEMIQIFRWASAMSHEASDNPCRARCAPKCLRRLLPVDHYLQTWRVPKRRRTVHGR
jgi:hypothetical protein